MHYPVKVESNITDDLLKFDKYKSRGVSTYICRLVGSVLSTIACSIPLYR